MPAEYPGTPGISLKGPSHQRCDGGCFAGLFLSEDGEPSPSGLDGRVGVCIFVFGEDEFLDEVSFFLDEFVLPFLFGDLVYVCFSGCG